MLPGRRCAASRASARRYRRVHADLVKRLAPPFSRGPDESFELHKGKGDAKGKKGPANPRGGSRVAARRWG